MDSAWQQLQTAVELDHTLKLIGKPLFHTLAADRDGDMFFGELSAMPNIAQAQPGDRVTGSNQRVATLAHGAIIAFDGDRAECQWRQDPEALAATIRSARRRR